MCGFGHRIRRPHLDVGRTDKTYAVSPKNRYSIKTYHFHSKEVLSPWFSQRFSARLGLCRSQLSPLILLDSNYADIYPKRLCSPHQWHPAWEFDSARPPAWASVLSRRGYQTALSFSVELTIYSSTIGSTVWQAATVGLAWASNIWLLSVCGRDRWCSVSKSIWPVV